MMLESAPRNQIILAREITLIMEMEELSRADLARKLGLSRARVTQMLNLLKLPEELLILRIWEITGVENGY
ncbi:MAG: hypothetical protein KAW14_01460 [Candidatus Aegiribacteria sp.]|nr:hypothetical protein [Candidatus Aegiribacteria sp.]